MLTIKTTGVEDYLDGSANIKALIIGGPGAGKTRTSSYWPKPIFLDCEEGRGSLVDRNMPYAEVKSSQDMLDALVHFKALERTPKAQRQFQTIVVDTIDAFQRLVKDEWMVANRAQTFSGFDAWGYLDSKMNLLTTRLLNLDYNVIVLAHFTEKTHKDGDATIREFGLQLQGSISSTLFNDFGLIGWLGTYWDAEDGQRVQKRGLTFQPTPDRPFLKDRFNVTGGRMLPIEFVEQDYLQLWEAFFNRPEFESFAESQVVGEIPTVDPVAAQQAADAERLPAPQVARVAPPAEGGPVAGITPTLPEPKPDPSRPLDRMNKEELTLVAKGLGIAVRGNMLKAEIISSIDAARAAQASTAPKQPEPTTPAPAAATPSAASPATSPQPSASADSKVDPWAPPATPTTAPESPSSSPSTASSQTSTAAASAAAPQPAASASPSSEPADAEALVAQQLGGEVISEENSDTPATPQAATPPTPVAQPSSAPSGPSACADCGADLTEAWKDPAQVGALRMTFVKQRRYLCSSCA